MRRTLLIETGKFAALTFVIWIVGWIVVVVVYLATHAEGPDPATLDLGAVIASLGTWVQPEKLVWLPVIAGIAAVTRDRPRRLRFGLHVIAAAVVALGIRLVRFAIEGPEATALTPSVIAEDVSSFVVAALLAALATAELLRRGRQRGTRVAILALLAVGLAPLSWILHIMFQLGSLIVLYSGYEAFELGRAYSIAFVISLVIAATAAVAAGVFAGPLGIRRLLVAAIALGALALICLGALAGVALPIPAA